MTAGESLFSFLKPQGILDEAACRVPPPATASPPPQGEDLSARVAALEGEIKRMGGSGAAGAAGALEDRIKKLESDRAAAAFGALEARIKKLERTGAAPAVSVEGFERKLQAAQFSVLELEQEMSGIKRQLDAVKAGGQTSQAEALSTVVQLKEALGLQRGRVGTLEEIVRRLDPGALNSLAISVSLYEGRLKSLETGLADELKERFTLFDTALRDAVRKAGAAQETATGSFRRIEKIEERTARLSYLEDRLNSNEDKLRMVYELEAFSQSLKASVEGMGKSFNAAMRGAAVISAEHEKIASDFESLSRQVKHLEALFNQFRTELAFLMPKKQENPGG